MKRQRLAAVPVVISLCLVAAGCGSSSNAASSKTGDSTVAAIGSLASTATTKTPASTSTSSSPTFANVSNCSQLTGIGQKLAKAFSSALGQGGSGDLKAAVSDYQQLADASPSAIKPDLELMSHAFGSFVNALGSAGLKSGGTPTATQLAKLQTVAKSFQSAKLQAAAKHLESWAQQNCS